MKTFILITILAVCAISCASQKTATRSQITLNQEPPVSQTDNVQEPVDALPPEITEEEKEKQKNYGVTLMMLMVTVGILLGSI